MVGCLLFRAIEHNNQKISICSIASGISSPIFGSNLQLNHG